MDRTLLCSFSVVVCFSLKHSDYFSDYTEVFLLAFCTEVYNESRIRNGRPFYPYPCVLVFLAQKAEMLSCVFISILPALNWNRIHLSREVETLFCGDTH